MRAISLHQPWATAVALGSKTIETRHWSTDYRGPLAIHAAKRFNPVELAHLARMSHWKGALFPLLDELGCESAFEDPRELRQLLPLGALVAVCNLVECIPTRYAAEPYVHEVKAGSLLTAGRGYGRTRDSHAWALKEGIHKMRRPRAVSVACWDWCEAQMGNFEAGRYAWVLDNIRPLKHPVPCVGQRNFFSVLDSLVKEAL